MTTSQQLWGDVFLETFNKCFAEKEKKTPVNHEGAEHNVRQHVTMAYLSFLSSTMSLFWKDQFLFIYTQWTVWIHFRKCNTLDFF